MVRKLIGALEVKARRRRYELFVRLLSLVTRPITILDVGGLLKYWRTVDVTSLGDVQIELLNIHNQDAKPPFKAVVGDARDLSRYPDRQFNVVFSNSVIGHVGSFQDQQRMANEIRRVGQRFFVQTPNHGFLVDWRTLVPFFHFLPTRAQAWCFEHFRVGTYRRASCRAEAINLAHRIRNIRRCELPILFPNAAVVSERVLGLTKSFMIHSFA